MSKDNETGAQCTCVGAQGRTSDEAGSRPNIPRGHRIRGAEPLHAPFKLGLSREQARPLSALNNQV